MSTQFLCPTKLFLKTDNFRYKCLSYSYIISVTKAGVIIHPDNMSGHLPIFCKFDMDQLNLDVERLTSTPKPSWGKASLEQQGY